MGVSLVVLVGLAALAIDIAHLSTAQTELQRAADAAALAGALELLNEDRLKGPEQLQAVLAAARRQVQHFGEQNFVDGTENILDLYEDVTVGRWTFMGPTAGQLLPDLPENYNGVEAVVYRNADRAAPITLAFAGLFGRKTQSLRASAVAAFDDAIAGYRVTAQTGNAQLLPFALHEHVWEDLLSGELVGDDNFRYDHKTKTVLNDHGDDILEINLYPGAGDGQLPPGNFGTVNIGPSNNSTADLARQILYGVSEADLAYFGGELRFNANGEIELNGNPGLSAAIKRELAAIIGQSRAIPLFRSVSGPGNNATFVVVGFAGIRVMDVKLTGPMNRKRLIVQPANVTDSSAITEPYWRPSYGVYRPVTLVK